MSSELCEYEFPPEVVAALDNYKVSIDTLNKKIQDYEKTVALLNEKIAVCKAYQQNDNVQSIHTVRTFLAGKGIPFDDLGNWEIKDSKAVRKEKEENADGEG